EVGTFAGSVEEAEDVEHRRLPRPGRPHDGHVVAPRHAQMCIDESRDRHVAGREHPADTAQFHHRAARAHDSPSFSAVAPAEPCSSPTTTRSPSASWPSTGVTSTRPPAASPGSTVTVRKVPSSSSTCTIVEPSAVADRAAAGTARTAPPVELTGMVTRTLAPTISSGISSGVISRYTRSSATPLVPGRSALKEITPGMTPPVSGFSISTAIPSSTRGASLSRTEERRASSEPDTVRKADRKSTRLNSSHVKISYAVFCLKKTKINS